jgi:hypothetical protein
MAKRIAARSHLAHFRPRCSPLALADAFQT